MTPPASPDADPTDPHQDAATEPCLRGPDNCKGPVSGRPSFGGTGTTIYECARHMTEAWDRELELRSRYPTQPPSDWDPMDAGESWDADGWL